MIKIKLQTASLHPTDTNEHYMYDKGHYARLREEMDIDWENEFKPCKNVEDIRIRIVYFGIITNTYIY